MPLWKLQTVASEHDEFLYREAEFADDSIRLLPGVPAAFRALYGLVLDAVRGAWLRQANRPLLGNPDLASFLFSNERASLDGFRGVLRDHQAGRCLYCRKELRGAGCVDHFIAWSRYPVDLGHNLVLAHDACNAKKRDFLAYATHLERWRVSHMERASELAQRFDSLALPHEEMRSRAIAWWRTSRAKPRTRTPGSTRIASCGWTGAGAARSIPAQIRVPCASSPRPRPLSIRRARALLQICRISALLGQLGFIYFLNTPLR